jgi:DinB superfamily
MTQDQPQGGEPATPAVNIAEMKAMLQAFGRTPQELAENLETAIARFETQAARARQDGRWLTAPAEGKWSPAQITEHVLLVNEGTARVVALLTGDKPLRPGGGQPGEYRDGKRQAPAATLPGEGSAWETLEERWAANRNLLPQLTARLAGADEGRTFFHAFMGELGAADWLRMASYHTRHHRRQLEG